MILDDLRWLARCQAVVDAFCRLRAVDDTGRLPTVILDDFRWLAIWRAVVDAYCQLRAVEAMKSECG